jgi:hypothetical protein
MQIKVIFYEEAKYVIKELMNKIKNDIENNCTCNTLTQEELDEFLDEYGYNPCDFCKYSKLINKENRICDIIFKLVKK